MVMDHDYVVKQSFAHAMRERDARASFVRPFGVSARLGISEYQAATPMFKILGRHPPVAADQGR